MRKTNLIILILLSFVLLVTSCGNKGVSNKPSEKDNSETSVSGEYNEKEADYVIKLATSMKASELDSVNPGGVAMSELKKYVEENTNGKVIIKFFLGGQLASTNEERVTGLQNGAFDMENLNTGSWSEFTDAFTPLSAPYLFITPEVAQVALSGEFGNRMNEQLLTDTGIRNLGFVGLGYRELTNSKREVKVPDDVKGLKIRTMSDPYQIETWKALGAAVTPTAYSELYTALQQGMVDGQENPLTNLYTSGMYEIQPYLTMTSHNYTTTTFVINEEFYKSLPEEYQVILQEGVDSAISKAREIEKIADEQILEAIKEDTKAYVPTTEELKLWRDATESVRSNMLKDDIGEEYYNFIINEIEKIEKDLNI